MNIIGIITVSLLMAFAVGADIKYHGDRRSKWWILAAFLLGIIGAVAYFIYDRVIS